MRRRRADHEHHAPARGPVRRSSDHAWSRPLNGTAADVWVFKIGTGGAGALTGTGFQVVMGGSAQACNVYWRTAGAATMTGSSFQGTILSGAAFTMTGGSYTGRALATTDVTVTDAAPMTFAGCSAPTSI